MNRGLLVFFAAAAVGSFACQAIVSRSGHQCTSTEECRSRGGEFASSRCSNDGVCEGLSAPDAGLSVGTGCATSFECKDRLGVAARCVEGSCAPLLLDDPAGQGACVILGPAESDTAVLLGSLTPQGGAAGTAYLSARESLRSTIKNWNTKATGDRARQLAAVDCDESRLTTVLPHLLRLHPKAFIGPYTNGKTREYLKTAGDIPTFSPTADDLSLAQVDPRRRLFSCTPNLDTAVKPFDTAASFLASKIASDRGIAKSKVVLIHTDDPADVAFMTRLEAGLLLGGAPAVGQAQYKRIELPFDAHVRDTIVAQAQTVAIEKPDLILMTTSLLGEEFTSAIDLRWGALFGAAPRPAILMMRSSTALEGSLKNVTTTNPNRFFAIDWVPTTDEDSNRKAFAGEFIAREIPVTPAMTAVNDCGYAAFYAMIAAAVAGGTSTANVNAQQVIDGVATATGGMQTLNLVPDDVTKGIALLSAGGVKTRLVGTSVTLGFQPNQTALGKAGLYCISSDTAGPARTWSFAGIRYDSATGASDGTLSCP